MSFAAPPYRKGDRVVTNQGPGTVERCDRTSILVTLDVEVRGKTRRYRTGVSGVTPETVR